MADAARTTRRSIFAGVALAPLAAVPALASKSTAEVDTLWAELLASNRSYTEVAWADRANGNRMTDADWEPHYDRINDAEDRIEALPRSLEVITACMLIETFRHASTYETLGPGEHGGVRIALEGLRPLISGAVAETVDDLLAHPNRPFGYSTLWSGYVEPGKTAVQLYLNVQDRVQHVRAA